MTAFKIEVQDQAVRQALTELAGKARDLSPAMRSIARLLRNTTEDAFAKQASPFGGAWAPLKKSTLKGRKGGGVGAKILQDSGQLAASLTATADATSATLTAGKAYAAIHQLGGQAGRGKKTTIPPRPFMPIDKAGSLAPATATAVIEVLRRHLAG